jgi:molybdopterin converting factor small subunit
VADVPADHVPAAQVTVTVRYFAAARASAGTTDENLAVVPADGGAGCTIGDVLDAAVGRHGPDLRRILLRCSFLLDEVAVHGRQTPVTDGQSVDVLPPFAGG